MPGNDSANQDHGVGGPVGAGASQGHDGADTEWSETLGQTRN